MGTHLFDSLRQQNHLDLRADTLTLTPSGHAFATRFGIDMQGLGARKTSLCRECLDWSERRSHLAGSLGRALMSRFEDLGWAKRDQQSRIVTFSRAGQDQFYQTFPAP